LDIAAASHRLRHREPLFWRIIVAKKSRGRRKRAIYRPNPGDELSIEQLKAIARYCGFSLVHDSFGADLVDHRTSYVVARGDIALNHLRSLYVERDLGPDDIPELATSSEGGL
jgi:hypothetical protein